MSALEGTLYPGLFGVFPRLNARNVFMTSTSTFEIDLRPSVVSGQLLVAGVAILNGATLQVNAFPNIVPGQTFTIMTHASGTFANLPEGAVVTPASGTAQFHISYAGGPSRSDVVLTAF